MIAALFWGATATIVYTLVVFPIVTLARAVLRPRPYRQADIMPSVSVVLAARNEAAVIEAKVDNLGAVDYPADCLQVVIASDGSDDETVRLARSRAAADVVVLDLPRVGKAAALQAAVDASTGDVLVFTDANSMFRPDAIRRLVRALADEEVGGVAGNQVYAEDASDDSTAVGERSYWDFDRAIKRAQSDAGNVIAATGAIYAIRRELFRPIPAGVTDDFYLSLAVIDAGKRLVFDPSAVAVERVASSRTREYGRKVRIMTRGLRCVAVMRQLLDPRRTGFYAVELFSHKVLMRTMAVPLLVAFVTSLALAPRNGLYALAAWLQTAFYGLAAVGTLLAGSVAGTRRFVSLPAYFCLVQVASLHAAWNLLRGNQVERWEPTRSSPETRR